MLLNIMNEASENLLIIKSRWMEDDVFVRYKRLAVGRLLQDYIGLDKVLQSDNWKVLLHYDAKYAAVGDTPENHTSSSTSDL